jgi:hypothetical protein
MNSLKIKFLICFGVWLLFAALAVAIGLSLTDWLGYRQLSKGVETRGIVTAKEPNNHEIIRYSYTVGEQTYKGLGHGGDGNPSFDDLKIGDKVSVFYDPAKPEHSAMGFPQDHLRVEAAGIIFLVIFLPLFPLAVTIILVIVVPKLIRSKQVA